MKITVSVGGNVTYQQVTSDHKALGNVISHMMTIAPGDHTVTSVINGNNEMTFKTEAFDNEPLIRKVNGIMIREKKAVSA